MKYYIGRVKRSLLFIIIAVLCSSCMQSPEAPPTPQAGSHIWITDSTGIRLDSLHLTPQQAPCLQARVGQLNTPTDIQLRWNHASQETDSTSFCLTSPPKRNGADTVWLWATDSQGGQDSTFLPILWNTPPQISPDSLYFSPRSSINGSAQPSLHFSWLAWDTDTEDTLHITLRIGEAGQWLDSLHLVNELSVLWHHPFQPGREYQWQVIAQDRFGARTSGNIYTFRTHTDHLPPGTLLGSVDATHCNACPVVLLAENGDTLQTISDSQGRFQFFVGTFPDTIRVWAWDAEQQRSSDTLQALMLTHSPTILSQTLHFP